MAIASIDNRIEKFKNLYAESFNKDLSAINESAEASKNDVVNSYNNEIKKAQSDYNEQKQLNEIQKYVNEREIAEKIANDGLNMSGLNETKIAETQLSYDNNKSKIDTAMNKAIENFKIQMNAKLNDIEEKRLKDETSLRQKYDNTVLKAAKDEYNTEVKAETARYKADLKASSKANSAIKSEVYTYSRTVKDNMDNSISIFRNSKGKELKIETGKNPYTNTLNTAAGNGNKKWADIKDNYMLEDSQKAAALYGTFENGYQPKGVVFNNKHYGKIKGYADIITTDYGTRQKIWETSGESGITRYWLWDGTQNSYFEVKKSNGQWLRV